MTTGLTGKSTRRPSEREFSHHKIHDLVPHPLNSVLYGSEELEQAFVTSIKRDGILQPIAIARMSFKSGGSYENYIVSGHRRWLAAKQLGFKKVPTVDLYPEGNRQLRTEHHNELLIVERLVIDANRQRVKTESQKDAEAAALLRIESELAKLRQQAGVRLNSAEGGGKAVEKVAEITGESPDTVRKRAAVHAAGVNPDERNKQSTNAAFNRIQNNKPKSCKCPECGEMFNSVSNGLEHGKKAHGIKSHEVANFKKRLLGKDTAPVSAPSSDTPIPLQPVVPKPSTKLAEELTNRFGNDGHVSWSRISGLFTLTLNGLTEEQVIAYSKVFPHEFAETQEETVAVPSKAVR
jgi:ParB-like chromosome segregation protein Spo0J